MDPSPEAQPPTQPGDPAAGTEEQPVNPTPSEGAGADGAAANGSEKQEA